MLNDILSRLPMGPWYPVDSFVMREGAMRGAYLMNCVRRRLESKNICGKCGGLTVDYIRYNPDKNYNNNSVVCICRYGKVRENEVERRDMGIYISHFIGELRHQEKGGKMPKFWPKIELQVKEVDLTIGSKGSAFKPYGSMITLGKVANDVERDMVNILIG